MSEPWSGTTKEALQDKARALGVSEAGTREELYHRIEQTLRDKVLEMDTTDEEAELIQQAQAARAGLAIVPSAADADAVMEEWRAGVVEPASTLPETSRWEQMERMAKVLCRSTLVPQSIRSGPDPEANVMVMLLAANDLGLTSTLAFQKIHPIDGKPTLAAELMRLLMQRDGHDFKIVVTKDAHGNATEAEVLINRKEWRDDDWRGDSYSLEDARTAGLLNKQNWKQHPRAMLIARATAAAARLYCADSLGGISFTPEELGAIDVEGVDWNAPSPTPEPILMTDEHLAQIDFAITVLEDSQREWLATEWKAKGCPALHPRRADAVPLTEDWVPTITAMLKEASEQPTDAEVVDGPAGVLVPRPGGERVDTPDPTLTPEGKVEALRESIETSDAMLNASTEERATIARQVLAEAKAKAESAGIIDKLCDDCGKPLNQANTACSTHPF